MSNTNEKLIQLAETKSSIRDAIISKGVEVDASLPFNQYPDKIKEIKSGGSEEDIQNFDKIGDLVISSGICSNFSSSRYIKNAWNTNEQNGVFCIKFRTSYNYSSSYDYVIASVPNTFNLDCLRGRLAAWSYSQAKESTIQSSIPYYTWIYVCIKFTNNGNTVNRDYYYSTTGYSLSPSDFKTTVIEAPNTATEGAIGVSYPDLGRAAYPFEIDMANSYFTDYDGNVIKHFYEVGNKSKVNFIN